VQALKQCCAGCGRQYPHYYFQFGARSNGLCIECHTANMTAARPEMRFESKHRAAAGLGVAGISVAAQLIAGDSSPLTSTLHAHVLDVISASPSKIRASEASGVQQSRKASQPVAEDQASLLLEIEYYRSHNQLHPRASDDGAGRRRRPLK
jgi:hypothetical protein